MAAITTIVVAAKLAVFGLGLLVVRLAYRAYRPTGARSLRSPVAWRRIAHRRLVHSVLTAIGFVVLVHSLYVIESSPGIAATSRG